MDLPFEIEPAGDGWACRPVGTRPSADLVRLWADGGGLPADLRWTSGLIPTPLLADDERTVDVDQTNHSVVVGQQAIVKWHAAPLIGPHPAPDRLRRLAAAGFPHMPALWFLLEWRTPAGDWAPVATAVDYIASAADGWTWCLSEARRALGVEPGHPTPFAAQLGRVTATMHEALADGPAGPVAVHGDFHVGQVLRDAGRRMYVVDFDGNPTLSPAERLTHRPAAYDVAGMLLSLENVGHVVQHHQPDVADRDVVAWTDQVQEEFLTAYREEAGHLLDETLLERYVDEQIQRELAYATRYLPRWRYVPEAALRRRGAS